MKEIQIIIETILDQFPEGDIYAQFASRGIKGIRLVELPEGMYGHLWFDLSTLHSKPEDWVYVIELQVTDTLNQWIISTGHELGHTFESFQNVIPGFLSPHIAKLFYAQYGGRLGPRGWVDWLEVSSEVFCDMFARRWLNYRNNRAEVIGLLNLLRERKEILFGRALE